jgi:transposase
VIGLVAEAVGCPGCGVVARPHGRSAVDDRDLAAFGRPARLPWRKRRFRCEEPRCRVATRTESSPASSARCLLTDRAGLECCLQVGFHARPVAQMARELGVRATPAMAAVAEHGEPLVDDPERVGAVRRLGVDETPG